MPKVQTYRSQVSDSNLPDVRVQAPGDANSYGAANAQALGNVGQAVDQFNSVVKQRELELKQQRDTMKVLDISNKFDADNLDFFHNKETGLFSQKMDAAQGSYQKAQKYFGDKMKEYEGMAENDTQRQALRQYLSGRQKTYLYNASVFESQQFQASREATTNAAVSSSVQGIAANYNNFDGINSHLTAGVQAIKANSIGKPAEAVSQEILKMQTQGLSEAVKRALDDKQPDIAAKIMETYKDYIDPTVQGDLTKVVRNQQQKTFVMQTADALAAKYRLPDGTVDLSAALPEIDAIKDPDVRQSVHAAVMTRASDANAIKHQQDNQKMDNFLKVLTNKGSITTQADLDNLLSQSGLTGRDYLSALSLGKQFIGSNQVVTTPEVWKEVHDRIVSGEIRDSVQLWREYGDKMSFADLKSFTGTIDTLAKAFGKIGEKTLEQPGVKEMVKQIADQVGLKDDKFKMATSTLYSKLIGEFQARAEQKGGPLSVDEIQQIVSEQLIKVPTQPGWFGTSIGQKQDYLFNIPAGTPFTKSGLPAQKVED